MLVTREDGELQLVTQVEHARVAGELAAHWGNDDFGRVEPAESAVYAVAHHDEGWLEVDEEVAFNAEERRPLHFLEIPMPDHIRLYRRGVRRVAQRDAYAGLLVGMHWSGLYRARWDLQPRRESFEDDRAGARAQDAVVAAEEYRWISVKRSLAQDLDLPRSQLECGLWRNYDVLQTCDLLSLFVCMSNLAPPPAGSAAEPLSSSLNPLDQQPGVKLVDAVPLSRAGERPTLTLTAVERMVVAIDPYPLDQDELTLEVAARRIADRPYADAADARDALAQAAPVTRVVTLVRR